MELDYNWISNIYCCILLIILIPSSLIVTWQVIQIILLESAYRNFENQPLYSLADEKKMGFVKILLKKQLWFTAIRILELEVNIGIQHRYKYFNAIGFIYCNIHQYNLAKKYYLDAIEIKDDYMIAVQNLAQLYEKQKV